MVSKPLMVLLKVNPSLFAFLCENLIIRPRAEIPTRLGAATSGPAARFNQIMCKFFKSQLWWGVVKKHAWRAVQGNKRQMCRITAKAWLAQHQRTVSPISHVTPKARWHLAQAAKVCICVKTYEQEYLRLCRVGGLICFQKAVLT